MHWVNDANRNTVEPSLHEHDPFEVQIAFVMLKRYELLNSSRIIQTGDNVLCSENHKVVNYTWNKEVFLHPWKQSIIVHSV